MNILNILKLYGMFKDVRATVAEEKGKAGWWYSRKFIGAVLVFGAAVALYLTGIEINADIIEALTSNLESLATACIGIYGGVMFIVSLFKKK